MVHCYITRTFPATCVYVAGNPEPVRPPAVFIIILYNKCANVWLSGSKFVSAYNGTLFT